MMKSTLALIILSLATLNVSAAQGAGKSGMPVKVSGVITYNFVLQ